MLVEIPHKLGEYTTTKPNNDDEDDGNQLINAIRFIFLIKHKLDELSCLLYIYTNGKFEINFIDESSNRTISKNVVKDSSLLYDISKPWGKVDYIRINIDFESDVISPYGKIEELIFEFGLDINDCTLFICTYTKNKYVIKNKSHWLYNDIKSKVIGHFVPFRDDTLSDNWRRFTKEDYRRFYGDLQLIKGVNPTFTNEIETTTIDPRYCLFKELEKNAPEFVSPKSSNSITDSQRLKSEILEREVKYDRKKIDENRKTLVMLHLIFKKLRSKNIHTLILTQMLPTPKYAVGSIVYHFNYLYTYVIKDIYMYLDLNYSWNIKYLCAEFSEVSNPDVDSVALRFLKQRDLTIAKGNYYNDIYNIIPYRDLNYTLENSLFEYDTSLWEYNNKTAYCRKFHFKRRWKCKVYNCNNKVNYNGIKCKYHSGEGSKWKMRCHHKKCNGPDRLTIEEFSKMCPVIKITKMETDFVTHYDIYSIVNLSTLNRDFTVNEKKSVLMEMNSKTDNTMFSWRYTKEFV